MRLDKYLKVSRLIKRRTIANEACDTGRISVNGKVQKASYDVKVGDVISIRFGEKSVEAKVLSVQETVRKDEAAVAISISMRKQVKQKKKMFKKWGYCLGIVHGGSPSCYCHFC